MRATQFEFRLRMPINAAIIILGFWAPWDATFKVGRRVPLLEWLALQLASVTGAGFTVTAPAVIVTGILLAALAVVLRVWGTAYLGTSTVQAANMKAGEVVADGPYRFVRNPLYIGLWFMVTALSLLMPPTGAPVTMALITIFLLRLILGEEAFLVAKLGQPYCDYVHAVPRLLPRLRNNVASGDAHPRWLRALLAELMPIGVFVTFAFFSWRYDNELMGRSILVSFGISLIVRAILAGEPTKAQ